MDLKSILNYELLNVDKYVLKVHHAISIIVVIFLVRVLIWLSRKYVKKRIDQGLDAGRLHGVFQLFKYFIVLVGVIVSLEIVGVKFTFLLAGSAALLVGLGFGIQSIFNDIVSGIILLFETTISVGDIVEVDGLVGKVLTIDLRTSKIATRQNIVIVVPNSKLVSEYVINWSHNRDLTRFNINVGVAYGSDLTLVKNLLEESASENKQVSSKIAPIARFINFGDSSLDFELLFYSREMFGIEFVKSDIRFTIDRKFREHKVVIPFPQRDLNFKNEINIDNTSM